jgi:hypothetical protein
MTCIELGWILKALKNGPQSIGDQAHLSDLREDRNVA